MRAMKFSSPIISKFHLEALKPWAQRRLPDLGDVCRFKKIGDVWFEVVNIKLRKAVHNEKK